MNPRNLATDWRIVLLVVVVVLSVIALIPGPAAQGPTALSFGLDLDGGTRLQLSPVGSVAVTQGNVSQSLADNVSTDLGVPVEPYATGTGGLLEVRGDVPDSRVREVMQQHDVEVTEIRDGVTQSTLDSLRNAVQTRLGEALGGGSGAQVTLRSNLLTGENFVVVEVPGETNASRISNIIQTRGRFEIRVQTTGNNTTHVVYGDAVLNNQVSAPVRSSPDSDQYEVSFQLDEEGSQTFSQLMRETGATENPNEHPVIMLFNEEEVFRAPLSQSLADLIQEGAWEGGGLQVTGLNESQAQVVSISLRSGALPTPVVVSSSTTISPVQGEAFKRNSLITGLIAVLAVGLAIFWRYRDLRIAVPMVLTGLAEVLALLGFAAALNFNIDLSHIAGLIAVIGTGVDDLVIIADEVLERGEIRSSSVYRKRIKRAFIIIGMAAVTTIGAMSPLVYLGLGRISGFAIITIVGVLIGVLVTRPAYGSILRELLTES